MTHPDYRKKDLLTQILKELFKELEKDQFDCLYSFPTRIAAWNLMKEHLIWEDVGELLILQYSKSHRLEGFPQTINFVQGEADIKSIERTEGLLFTNKSVRIKRTLEYLKWKLIDNPNHSYYFLNIFNKDRLMGVFFYKYYEKSIDIIEYFYSADFSSMRLPNLVNGYNYLLDNGNISNVNMWIFKSSEEYNCLTSKGATASDLITHFGYVSLKGTGHYKDSKNWHLSFMDSDIY